MASEKEETVCLIKQRLTQKHAVSDHLRKEHGIFQRENGCPFTGVSRNGGRHPAVFCTQHDFDLDNLFQFVGLLDLSSAPQWASHSTSSLPCFPLCILANWWSWSALHSHTRQMPHKCHMQLPSSSAPHRRWMVIVSVFLPSLRH